MKKVYSDTLPERMTLRRHGNFCTVELADKISPCEAEEHGRSGYSYDCYSLTVRYRSNLAQDLAQNRERWLRYAKAEDFAQAAAEIRDRRDQLLQESDQQMQLDRMGVQLPERVSAANLLPTLRALFAGLGNALSGSWADYRQQLRDIPSQDGFPYRVSWPEPPAAETPGPGLEIDSRAFVQQLWALVGMLLPTEHLTDAQHLQIPDLHEQWQPGLHYAYRQVVKHGQDAAGQALLYEIVQPDGVDSLAHQQPGGTGMLAVYRPIVREYAGMISDPIPFVYGMDVLEGRCYRYEGATYLANLTVPACTFYPGQDGVHFWVKQA